LQIRNQNHAPFHRATLTAADQIRFGENLLFKEQCGQLWRQDPLHVYLYQTLPTGRPLFANQDAAQSVHPLDDI